MSERPSGARAPGEEISNWRIPATVSTAAAIASGQPGKCVAASGAAAVLATCANSTAQHWQPQPDGTLRLNGKCLLEGGTTVRSILSVGSCSGAAATKWKLVAAGPIATELVNAASGLCASVPASGAKLIIAACANPQNPRYSVVVLGGLSAAATSDAPEFLMNRSTPAAEVIVGAAYSRVRAMVVSK